MCWSEGWFGSQPRDFNDPFEFPPYIESAASDEAVRDYVEANFDKSLDAELTNYDALLQPGIGRRCWLAAISSGKATL